MPSHSFFPLSLATLALATSARAYWLMGAENILTTQRLDPVASLGKVSSHVHTIFGGSNFGMFTNTTASLRQSQCSSIPIPEDKSNYWVPQLYYQWKNGSFTSVDGGAVIYYLFDNPTNAVPFPDDFRMISGDPTLRSYDASSIAQKAVTFLCLDFQGVSTRHNELPAKMCPSGIRSQVNFQSCWDGKNVDSHDHKSHVSYLSNGPDSGTCNSTQYPVRLPRIFMEIYWGTHDFNFDQAMNTSQPFVFSHGDPTGYGYHGDFINGWDAGVLQRALNGCNCNNFGDAQCCVDKGIFHMNKGQNCKISKTVDEQVLGTLDKLPGNNPVVGYGAPAPILLSATTPALLAPVFVYTTGDAPPPNDVATTSQPAVTNGNAQAAAATTTRGMTASTSLSGPGNVAVAASSVTTAEPGGSATGTSSWVSTPSSGSAMTGGYGDGASWGSMPSGTSMTTMVMNGTTMTMPAGATMTTSTTASATSTGSGGGYCKRGRKRIA